MMGTAPALVRKSAVWRLNTFMRQRFGPPPALDVEGLLPLDKHSFRSGEVPLGTLAVFKVVFAGPGWPIVTELNLT